MNSKHDDYRRHRCSADVRSFLSRTRALCFKSLFLVTLCEQIKHSLSLFILQFLQSESGLLQCKIHLKCMNLQRRALQKKIPVEYTVNEVMFSYKMTNISWQGNVRNFIFKAHLGPQVDRFARYIISLFARSTTFRSVGALDQTR